MCELTLSQKKQYINNNEKNLKKFSLFIQGNNYKNVNDFINYNNVSKEVFFTFIYGYVMYKYSEKNAFYTLFIRDNVDNSVHYESEFQILKLINESNNLLNNELAKLNDIIKTEKKEYSISSLKGKLESLNVNNAVCFKQMNDSSRFDENDLKGINLLFSVGDYGNAFELTLEYNDNVYYEYLMKNILNSFAEFILNCINCGNEKISSIEYIPTEEKNRIVCKFNNNKVNYVSGAEFYHSKFSEISKIYPNKSAIIFENQNYTYGQINSMSNSLAHYLRKCGVRRNEIIPIICDRTPFYIISLLAVMKSGAAFVYIDSDFPMDRIKYLIKEVKAKIVLKYLPDGFNQRIIEDDDDLMEYNLKNHNFNENTSDLESVNQWNDLCYLFFTSGTTGKPKGTMITHDSLIHYCLCTQKKNGTEDIYEYNYENVLGFTKFTYAMTIIELFHSLIKNKTIVLCNNDEFNNSELLGDMILKYSIDYIVCTPSRIKKYLFDNKFRLSIRNVKYFNFGGEMVTLGFLKDLRKCTDAIFYNGYGLSEATAFCAVTSIDLTDTENESIVTVGQPACNYELYILDDDLKPLPVGVEGEIYISGYSISIGYLNLEKVTSERFIPCPFNQFKMYKTGDIGRWTNDGRIVYSGRKDFQVKINGQRIELGEIESTIKEIEGIDFITVLDRVNETTNDKYLVGYYITQNENLDALEIRNYLQKKLPKYMIPNYFMRIKEIPFNINGKLDRKALPIPDINDLIITKYEKPETETEERICKLYSAFFKINGDKRIGRNANFFELGGDSLNVITLLHMIEEEFNIKMNVKDVLKHSVICDLCQCIDSIKSKSINVHNSTSNDETIQKKNSKEFPVTSQQLGIYLDSIKDEESIIYNNPYSFKLPKDIDIEKIKQAFKKLFNNHEVLKSRYYKKEVEGGKVEVFGYIDDDCELKFESYGYENVKSFIRPFNLSQSPLIRVGFLNNEYLLIDIHHIICDGTTLSIVKDEVNYYYQNGNSLNELEIQFSDYAHYINNKKEKGIFKNQVEFYKKLFTETDYASVSLPKKLNKTNGNQSKKETVEKEIPNSISKTIDSFMKAHGISKTAFFISIYGYVLSKYSGQDIIYSTLISSNRNNHLIENMIGMFVTTLPILLKYENCDKTTFLDIIKNNMNVLMDVYINQDISFSELSKMLNLKPANNLFAFQPAKIFDDQSPSILKEEEENNNVFSKGEENGNEKMNQVEMSKFDIVFSIIEKRDNYLVTVEYNSELYESQMIERILESYIQVVNHFKSFEALAKDIEYIPEEEKTKIIKSFNNNSFDYDCNNLYHVEFSRVANKPENQNKYALICNDMKITYKKLEEMSNSIAYLLRKSNVVGRDDIIPIISERSHYYVIAALGILKSGAAFLPIDPEFPKDRIKYMIKETQSRVVLKYITNKMNDQKIEEILGEINSESQKVVSYPLQYHDYESNTNGIENINQPNDLCYTIFTSGTTGKPKGTLISHNNLINFCLYGQTNNGKQIYTDDFHTSLASAKFSFDMSISEIFYPLLHNKCVVICNDNEYNDPEIIGEKMLKYGVDYIIITPSRIENYSKVETYKMALKKLKCILLGGEECKLTILENIIKNTNANIYNLYGPTEITVSCSLLNLSEFYKKAKKNSKDGIIEIPIGRPNCNNNTYILDKYKKPVPIGVEGEIYIGGYGVGRGYLNREELTKEKFVANPFNFTKDPHNGIMYRTGDLGKWTNSGEIDYLGRMDFQVKINGQRIELGEIESTIKEINGIEHCVVVDKKKENGDQYLICYYIPFDENLVNGSIIRKFLNEKLPRYMVPNYYKKIDEIPLSNNGKLNKEALPEPSKEDFITEKYVAPETEIEKLICKFFSKIFNIPENEIGRMSDFYELGGDSLNFIHFSSLIEKELNIKLHYKDIISHSMLSDLSQYLEEIIGHDSDNNGSGADHKIQIIERRHCKEFPITSQQLGIYIESIKNPNSVIYNIPNIYKYETKNININRIKEGFMKIFENQEIFRTYYGEKEINGKTEIVGFVDDHCTLTFEEYTFENAKTFVRPFDLTKAPLIRVGFIENKLLLVDMHHIVSDGVSFNIIQNQLNQYYNQGKCEPLEIQFSDYAIDLYERRNNGYFEKQIEFYKEIFSDEYDVLSIPEKSADESIKNDQKKNNDSYDCSQSIDSRTSRIINDYIKRNNISKTAFFISIYGYVMSKYSGQDIIYTSVISANRNNHYVENMSGMFVSTLPLLLKYNTENENMPFKDLIKNNTKLLIDIYNNQNVSFSELTSLLKLKKINNCFVYQPKSITNSTNGDDCVIRLFNDENNDMYSIFGSENKLDKEIGTKFDITFNVIENENDYSVHINYNDEIYESKVIRNILNSFLEVIRNLDSFETETIKSVEYIPEKEKERIVYGFNANMIDYGCNKFYYSEISNIAKQYPERYAIIFEDMKITFKELDEMSNSMAHYLRHQGVQRNDIVPIISDRSPYYIISVIGISKAGGAYLPIDIKFPIDRIEYILEEVKPKTILYNNAQNIIDQLDSNRYLVHNIKSHDYSENRQSIRYINDLDDLCYVLFTSGTTGKPKGTLITHFNIYNYVRSFNKDGVDNHRKMNIHNIVNNNHAEKVIAISNFAFDISQTEITSSLVNGITVVLMGNVIDEDVDLLVEKMVENDIKILKTTPTRFKLFLENKNFRNYLVNMNALIFGGEEFKLDLYNKIRKYSKCNVYNGYGPTETTVASSFVKVDVENKKSTKITIGGPITNCPMYILDKNKKPVPVGVEGEIYIGGYGVGKGYLNREELTKEKFVPNPFNITKDPHNGIIYRTGDLGKWTDDGEVDYIGRMDFQVKINGQRIELGEIENTIKEVNGVDHCVVIDKKKENGDQYLICYYISANEKIVNGSIIRKYLNEKLPRYMIPNYYKRIDEIPLSSSSKLNRKALPEPTKEDLITEKYVAPETDMERMICKFYSKIFNIPENEIGRMSDFYELGGDSLNVIRFSALVENELGVKLNFKDIMSHSIICDLGKHIEKKLSDERVKENIINYADDVEKLDDPRFSKEGLPAFEFPGKNANLFLTGATGFLGSYILSTYLKKNPAAKVYCLVRASSDEQAYERVRKSGLAYRSWNAEWEKNHNVIAVRGDLSQENFGIPADKWDYLCRDVKLIIHNGAMVHWMYPYEKMRNVNVLSTVQCLKMSTTYHLKAFYFVSSISVLSTRYYLENGDVMENDDLEGARYELDSGYGQSKWVSEKLIFKAIDRGVPACIIRPGFIVGNSKNGALNTDDFITRMIIDCIELKQYPNVENPINACPVDYVAGSIIQIASQERWLDNRVYHICHSPKIYYNDIFEELHFYGYDVKNVDYSEWRTSLMGLVESSGNKNALFPLLPFVINDLPGNTVSPTLNDNNTRRAIANSDVPVVNAKDVIGKYLAYLIKIGLIKPPTHKNAQKKIPDIGEITVKETIGRNNQIYEMKPQPPKTLNSHANKNINITNDNKMRNDTINSEMGNNKINGVYNNYNNYGEINDTPKANYENDNNNKNSFISSGNPYGKINMELNNKNINMRASKSINTISNVIHKSSYFNMFKMEIFKVFGALKSCFPTGQQQYQNQQQFYKNQQQYYDQQQYENEPEFQNEQEFKNQY